MRSLVFEGDTWAACETLRTRDRRLHQALCGILKELIRNDPCSGLGKPEPLRANLSGLWSRRLTRKDRVVYSFDDRYVYIFAIGGHYDSLPR
jgi:toxin YoeB